MITMKEVVDALLLPPIIFKDIALIALVLSVIQISPLKLDPWVWIKEFIALPKRMNTLETDYQNDKAYRWRSMILSRADRIRRGEKFSEERSIVSIVSFHRSSENFSPRRILSALDRIIERHR